MKKLIVIALTTLSCFQLSAQFNSTIRTGRPGQSIGAYTVGRQVFQVQTGVDVNQVRGNHLSSSTTLSNTVLRYGILENFEINGSFDWQQTHIRSLTENRVLNGISGSQIGFRFNVLERQGAIPAIGIQYRLLLKAQSQIFRREHTGSRIVVATSNRLFQKYGLVTNWGLTWTGNNQASVGTYAISLSFDLGKDFSGFVENYGNLWQGRIDTNFDTGIAYLVNNDFQLDLSGGWQGTKNLTDYFISLGLSWRVHHRML